MCSNFSIAYPFFYTELVTCKGMIIISIKFEYDIKWCSTYLNLEMKILLFFFVCIMVAICGLSRYVRNAGSLKMTAFVQGVPPEFWLLISNFDTVNIIQSIWEFIQFLYMLLEAKSQNFIGMGWKMNDLCMSILTWVKFKCAPFLATLKKAVLAVVEPLRSRFCD